MLLHLGIVALNFDPQDRWHHSHRAVSKQQHNNTTQPAQETLEANKKAQHWTSQRQEMPRLNNSGRFFFSCLFFSFLHVFVTGEQIEWHILPSSEPTALLNVWLIRHNLHFGWSLMRMIRHWRMRVTCGFPSLVFFLCFYPLKVSIPYHSGENTHQEWLWDDCLCPQSCVRATGFSCVCVCVLMFACLCVHLCVRACV